MCNRILLASLLATGAFGLAGCEPATDTSHATAAVETDTAAETEPAGEIAAELDELYAAYDEENLKLNPIGATFRGDHRYNDRASNNYDPEYQSASYKLVKGYLEKTQSYDPSSLSGQDRLNYDMFVINMEQAVEAFEDGINDIQNMLPLNQMFMVPSFMVIMGGGQSAQPFNTVEDYDNWLKRSAMFSDWTDGAIAAMREGLEKGVTQPKLVMEKTLPLIKAHVVDDVTESAFYAVVTNMPEDFSDEDRERLTVEYTAHIENVLVPAYRRLTEFTENEYIPNVREEVGLSAMTGGADLYAYNAKQWTTTDLTPQEIHEIGKQHAERSFEEMKKVRDRVGFDGDMQAFFEHLRTDPQQYFSEPQDLLDGYDELRTRINNRLPEIFGVMPKNDYEVREIEEFRAAASAAAQYRPGAPDGSRPGVFYVNTYKMDSRPKYVMEALSLHEASPGHHFQTTISSELEELPAFRRFGFFGAYIEGWGLYSESLGDELGLYEDPYQYFGMLYFDIWRANRLVVDTGLHAMGWTRQQAIDWMLSNSPMTEVDVVAEVDRYIAIPGQALSYKIGQLKLLELRDRAIEALGDDFDIREFHDEVLTGGSMPLNVLDAKIDRWIASKTG